MFGNVSLFKTPFPGRNSIPPTFVSFFVFYIFSYLLSKTMGCFSGCLMSSAGIQKLFCGISSAFTCSFDEFVGGEVSPCPTPPHPLHCLQERALKRLSIGSTGEQCPGEVSSVTLEEELYEVAPWLGERICFQGSLLKYLFLFVKVNNLKRTGTITYQNQQP